MDISALEKALLQFDLGPEDTRVPRSLDALKRASINLLRDSNDSEAMFLGHFFTNVSKIATNTVQRLKLSVKNHALTMQANPLWVLYLEKLGPGFLEREIRHELTHIILTHPEILSSEESTLTRCLLSIGMNTCVSLHLDSISSLQDKAPLCPICARDYIEGGRTPRQMKLFSEGNDKCQLCLGTGTLDLTWDKAKAIANHYGVYMHLPYVKNRFDHWAIYSTIKSSLPKAALDPNNSPNIFMLAEEMIVYNDNYERAVVDSLVQHAVSQEASRQFSTQGAGSPLLDVLKNLNRQPEVPFILKIRGTIGETLRDETVSTRSRPNRRFGLEYPGVKSIPKQRYIFAIDSSGSISQNEIKQVINEFLNIREYSDQIECRVLFFHTRVYFDKEIGDYTDKDLNAIQSGGTSFDALLSHVYLDKTKKLEHEDPVLIIYTDGYCSIHTPRNQVGRNIHWVLNPDGDMGYIRNWDPRANIIKIPKKDKH